MADLHSSNIDPVKNGFSLVNKKAPESVWVGLESNLSLSNDEYAISNAFNSSAKKAPEGSWQKVKVQLIIDQVWLNIDAELSKKRRRIFWLYFSGLGVVLLGVILAWMHVDNAGQSKSVVSNQLISGTDFSAGPYENVGVDIIRDSSFFQPVTATNADLKSETLQSDFSELKSDISILNDVSVEEALLSPKENEKEETFGDTLTNNENLVASASCPVQANVFSNRLADPLEKHQPIYKKHELGIVAGIDNTWIFNNDVRSGLSKYSLVDNKFSLGYHVGLNFYFNLNEKSAIGFQTDFISKMNQRYDYFEHGNLYTNNLSITQQKISLEYRYTTDRVLSSSQAFVFKGGTYFSRTSKSEFFANQEMSTDFTFTNYDFGLRAGIGSQYYWKNLIFEIGLKSDIGLLNIADSPNYSAKKFNYTTTYLTSLYFSLRYSF